MKKSKILFTYIMVLLAVFLSTQSIVAQKEGQLENMKMYVNTWDEIVNQGNINLINETNFDKNITLITSPENIVGVEDFKAFYNNYLTGFSDIEFTIQDVFGQGDKLVKHWNFKGTHTGNFFGIPATGNKVNINGVTLTEMKNGKIAQEQDFMDNMAFMQQLGLVSDPNNLIVIQKLYDNFAKGDVPAVLAVLDAKVVWNEAEGNALADGNPYIGPDAVLNGVFARIGSEYDYFKTADVQLHEMSNNQVLATMRYKAKLKKNGAVIDAQAAHLWTLKDGQVIAFQQYVDTHQLAEAEDAGSVPMIMVHNFYLPVSTHSQTAKAAYYKAEYLFSNLHWKEARAQLEYAIKEDPDFFMAYALDVYYSSSDKQAALIDKALAIDTRGFNEAEKIVRQQLVVLDKDPKAKMAKNMKSLVTAYPNTPQAYHWATLHAAYTDKDMDAALDYALKLAALSPGFGPNYNQLGYMYMNKKEMDKAQSAFEKYIALCPTEANPYDSMAEYYMVNKDYAKSAKYYDKAAAMGGANAAEKAAKARDMINQ